MSPDTQPDLLTPEEKDYFIWLQNIEKRAIIPLKWFIWGISLFIWLWSSNWEMPAPRSFLMFFLYMMFNTAQSYFFYFNRVTPPQIKPFCYLSYLVDIIFVTALIYLDSTRTLLPSLQSDFYVFYFLLVLRGFGLFRSPRENIVISLVISLLFIFTIRLEQKSFQFIQERVFYFRFFLIWVVTFMAWFIVDIINRQKNELIGVRERLLRAQHLAQVGEMTASLAHEINNPIGIISAYSEYLMRKLPKESENCEDFQVIQKEALRCKKIISELMDYSKPSLNEINKCDVRLICDEVITFLFHPEKEKHFMIEKKYDTQLPLILCDSGRLKQALVNIFLNAKQAMPDGGRIKSSVIRKTPNSNEILIEVEDTGGGIPKDLLPKIFDPFISGKREGTGLGLYITKQIIEAHKGTIEVNSKKDKGTIITLHLPVS